MNVLLSVAKGTADTIKLRMLKWEIILGNLGGPNIITKVFIRGGRRVRVGEGDYAMGDVRVLSQGIQGQLLSSLCLVSFFPGCIYSVEEDCIRP